MLIAQQRSALSGFTYDLVSPGGAAIGDLCFPDWAEARNARLKNPAPGRLSSRIDMTLSGAAYTIEFEYTRRGWENDTRYELMKDGVCVAAADVTVTGHLFRSPTVRITGPCKGELVRRFGRLKTRFDWVQGGQVTGRIEEADLFTMRRRLGTDLPPGVPLEVQGFLLFLVLVLAYG
ncbi:hypothetical protein [Hydrogenophaga sp. MI9]|uniref:hypothetical protein n=1 Tax=Hydrogenophaga sp. MI9 TaxID=3453719 RepID=UPI003EEBE158